MATRRRRVVWTEQARRMLDDTVAYIAQDSRPAAERLLIQAREAASSLDALSERGRVVPEFGQPTMRELFVQRHRLLYEVTPHEVEILATRVEPEVSLSSRKSYCLDERAHHLVSSPPSPCPLPLRGGEDEGEGIISGVRGTLPHPPPRHQAHRFFVAPHVHDLLYIAILEGAHDHRAEAEGDGLQVHVLSCVPNLHMDVPDPPLAVLPGRSPVDRGQRDHRRPLRDALLPEGRPGELRAPVTGGHERQG